MVKFLSDQWLSEAVVGLCTWRALLLWNKCLFWFFFQQRKTFFMIILMTSFQLINIIKNVFKRNITKRRKISDKKNVLLRFLLIYNIFILKIIGTVFLIKCNNYLNSFQVLVVSKSSSHQLTDGSTFIQCYML